MFFRKAESWLAMAVLFQQDASPKGMQYGNDVEDFRGNFRTVNHDLDFDLAPGPRVWRSAAKSVNDDDRYDEIDVKGLVLRMVRAAGVDMREDELVLSDDARQLTVTASREVAHEVARTIMTLRETMIGLQRVEMRAYEISDVDPSSLSPSLVLEASDADAREEALVRSGHGHLLRSGSSPLVDGRVGALELVTRRAMVRGFGTQIGGVAVRYDPIAGEDVDGVEATFRSSRIEGGTFLDLALRVSESDAPARTLAVDPVVWCAEPKPGGGAQMFHGKMPLELELPRHRFASAAGSFVVPDGKALWFPFRIATPTARSAYLVDLRVIGPPRPVVTRVKRGAQREFAFVDLGRRRGSGFRFEPFPRRGGLEVASEGAGSEFSRENRRGDLIFIWPSVVEADDHGIDLPKVTSSFAPLDGAPEGTEASLLSKEFVAIDSPGPIADELLARFLEPGPTPPTYDVTGRVRSGTDVVAEFRLPVVAGRAAGVWLGAERASLRSWDVDVADQTDVGIPIVGWTLDGIALAFEVGKAGDGKASVAVDGLIRVESGAPERLDLGSPETPLVESTRARLLALDTSAIVALGSATPLRIGGTQLAFEFTVAAR
jgi:hypothetical protein